MGKIKIVIFFDPRILLIPELAGNELGDGVAPDNNDSNVDKENDSDNPPPNTEPSSKDILSRAIKETNLLELRQAKHRKKFDERIQSELACKTCGRQFGKAWTLERHIKKDECNSLICQKCGYIFCKKIDLRRHLEKVDCTKKFAKRVEQSIKENKIVPQTLLEVIENQNYLHNSEEIIENLNNSQDPISIGLGIATKSIRTFAEEHSDNDIMNHEESSHEESCEDSEGESDSSDEGYLDRSLTNPVRSFLNNESSEKPSKEAVAAYMGEMLLKKLQADESESDSEDDDDDDDHVNNRHANQMKRFLDFTTTRKPSKSAAVSYMGELLIKSLQSEKREEKLISKARVTDCTGKTKAKKKITCKSDHRKKMTCKSCSKVFYKKFKLRRHQESAGCAIEVFSDEEEYKPKKNLDEIAPDEWEGAHDDVPYDIENLSKDASDQKDLELEKLLDFDMKVKINMIVFLY